MHGRLKRLHVDSSWDWDDQPKNQYLQVNSLSSCLLEYWISQYSSNAFGRHTSVRLGMSKHHFIVDENHSREWCDEDTRMIDYGLKCYSLLFWVLWVWASLVNQFTLMKSLRIISVFDSSFLNQNESRPNWMEVNSGKSIQLLTSQSITLKHNTRTTTECTSTELKWFERRHV